MSDDGPECHWNFLQGCHKKESEHYDGMLPWSHKFQPPVQQPEPHEMVPALAVTTWTCPHCGLEQDVWGEGAINSWMDCQSTKGCPSSWLSLDLGIAEALGLPIDLTERIKQ